MRLFLTFIFFIYFIIEYISKRKGYLLLGSVMNFIAIIFSIPYFNSILEKHYLFFKYGMLGLIIPFLFLFVKDKVLMLKQKLM